MKKTYRLPEIQICIFDNEDIITASNQTLHDFDGAESVGTFNIMTFIGEG